MGDKSGNKTVLDQDIDGIINNFIPNAPMEVKQAIAAYATGNLGVAHRLAERANGFTTAKQVEVLVGWPLSDHTPERTSEIWDLFDT